MHEESGSRTMKAIVFAAVLLLGAATIAAHAAPQAADDIAYQSIR